MEGSFVSTSASTIQTASNGSHDHFHKVSTAGLFLRRRKAIGRDNTGGFGGVFNSGLRVEMGSGTATLERNGSVYDNCVH